VDETDIQHFPQTSHFFIKEILTETLYRKKDTYSIKFTRNSALGINQSLLLTDIVILSKPGKMAVMSLQFPPFCRYIKGMVTTLDRSDKIKCFMEGFSSIFDISGTAFTEDRDKPSGFQKDYQALCGDWQNLGNDMRKAINQEKAANQGLYVWHQSVISS
jgi:hypothetical protein